MPQKRQLVFLFRCLVVISVIVALGYTVRQSWQQLTETDFRLASVHGWAWLEAIVVYLGAMFLACVFGHRILIALGQQPAFSKTLLAFFASQLGKYVPGKAMVATNHQGKEYSSSQTSKSSQNIHQEKTAQTPFQNIRHENQQRFQTRLQQHQTVRGWFQLLQK